MAIRSEVLPFVIAAVAAGAVVALLGRALGGTGPRMLTAGAAIALVGTAYMLYFFRDPERFPPAEAGAVVAGADGVVMGIAIVREDSYLRADAVRISIFLSLFDVHVNRAPIGGKSRFLGYFPGKRLFTFQEKSSELNQHNSILITGPRTRCLVNQIVGPVARRVVYWPDHEREVDLNIGDRIGMMKFGSRLDMLLPKDDVDVVVKVGQRVRAGETIVARLRQGGGS